MYCIWTKQNPHIAVTWVPKGRRSRGRPREAWRRTMEEKRQKMGFSTWNEAVAAASGRKVCMRQFNSPSLPVERQD